MSKYKRLEQRVVELKKIKERSNRMKYKMKLYGMNILTSSEINELKEVKDSMTDREKALGNMLHDLNETSKHCVELLDWYENDREALLQELEKLRKLNKELLNK